MKPSLNYFITFTTYGTWLHGDERKAGAVPIAMPLPAEQA